MDSRDYPEAYLTGELESYGTMNHAIDKAAARIKKLEAENARLSKELAAAQVDAKRYLWLREACGYVEDGSSTSVTISQDDATRDWIVRVGPIGSKHWWHGRSLGAAIDDAIAKENGK